jgi:hypothetical protein
METIFKAIKNKGVVLSKFILEPNEVAEFGVNVIRDMSKLNIISKLSTIRVVTVGEGVYKSLSIEALLTNSTQPPKLGSQYCSNITAGPKGCVGFFLGFNDPTKTIISVERLLINTPSSLSFEHDVVLASVHNPIKINDVVVESETPMMVSKGSKITTGLDKSDILIIKYK